MPTVALEMVAAGEFAGPLVLLSPSFSRNDESRASARGRDRWPGRAFSERADAAKGCARTEGAAGSTLVAAMLIASDLVAIIIVVVMTVLVVVVVLGLHVWGAVQDGREEKAMEAWRRRGRN